ncbi:hypothetical protein LEP1GSC168_1051 [Leptospira santarosai str. HAI134]|nr:hypothetical protein LEP1GSC168_1051 [Leptospira santarosai str. HAI134]EMO31511.1 hypothetical protein LEP1GSC175_0920 [Leptospira santarosai str. HAI821]EMP80337.1 hypothetical protein LEP1GSC162_2384 [Leptospira santarosai str. CBC1531]
MKLTSPIRFRRTNNELWSFEKLIFFPFYFIKTNGSFRFATQNYITGCPNSASKGGWAQNE